MKFLLLFLLPCIALATPVIDLQYQAHNLTGLSVAIDATGTIDDGGGSIVNYEWQLLATPDGSQTQLEIVSDGVSKILTDRSGIYSLAVKVYSLDGSNSTEYFSVYASQTNGQIVYGPVTNSVDVLCFLVKSFYACDPDIVTFPITNPNTSYSLIMSSTDIDRGIVTVNNDQKVHYVDHTGGADQFVKEVNLLNNNTLEFEMIANSALGSYTYSVIEQNLPIDTNDAPVGADIQATVFSEIPKTINVSATDPNGDTIFYKIIGEPLYGTASITFNGDLTYNPGFYVGIEDKVIVSAYDIASPSKEEIIIVTLDVLSNTPPSINFIADQVGNTETQSQTLEFIDTPGQVLTKSITQQPTNGTITFDPNTGLLEYIPNNGFTGSDSVEVTVTDDGFPQFSATAVISYTTYANTAPSMSPTANIDINENESIIITFDGFDPDSNQVTAYSVTQAPLNGTMTYLGGDQYEYKANINYSGTEQIIVTFSDNGNPALSASQTVDINILENNIPPTINGGISHARLTDYTPAEVTMNLQQQPTDPDGSIDRIVWDFGDGVQREIDYTGIVNYPLNSSVIHVYQAAGTYTATAIVVDDKGGEAYISKTIVVQDEKVPTTIVQADTYSGTAPLTVTFDSSNSIFHNGTPTNQQVGIWLWNDGSPLEFAVGNLVRTHTFNNPGTYPVAVLTQDNGGGRSLKLVWIYVSNPQGNVSPQTAMHMDKTSGDAPLTVNFDASDSVDGWGSGTGLSYFWSTSNNNSVKQFNENASFTHTFTAPGTYIINLRVEDSQGNSTTEVKRIRVNSPSYKSNQFYVYSKNGNQIFLDTTDSEMANGLVTAHHIIDWGDGTKESSNTSFFNHTYGAEGTYTITLETESYDGTLLTSTRDVTVDGTIDFPDFFVSFEPQVFQIPYDSGHQIVPSNFSFPVHEVRWNFDDGNIVLDGNADIFANFYDTQGIYSPSHIVTNSDGYSRKANFTLHANTDAAPPRILGKLNSCAARAPFQFEFDFGESQDPNGIADAIMIGDVLTSFTTQPAVYVDQAGSFSTEVTVLDNAGDTNIIEYENITVFDQDPPVGNLTPTLQVETPLQSLDDHRLFSFNMENSVDSDGYIACYQVDFGNGNKYFTTNGHLDYAFAADGTYNVDITAVDNWGAETTTTVSVDVFVPTPVPGRRTPGSTIFDNHRAYSYEPERKTEAEIQQEADMNQALQISINL